MDRIHNIHVRGHSSLAEATYALTSEINAWARYSIFKKP